ncbi:MAG: hypothetical protein IJ272_07405, partial [Clostridia bacterium]|nr:hypothetical protein [Clostridia bacterium]
HYAYDGDGNPRYIQTVDSYGTVEEGYLVTNTRGDVVAIVDNAGNVVAKYTYDAWGKLMSVTDASGNDIENVSGLGYYNSLRYRGYYYDGETCLYYLQSRYYDPQVKRFINADGASVLEEDQGSIVEHNLFVYCVNNPVNKEDSEGEAVAAANIIGAALGGVAGAALGCVLAKKLKLKGWKKAALISAAAVGGAVLGAFLGPYVAKLGRKVGAAVKKTMKLASKKKGVKTPKKVKCSGKGGACFVAGTKIATKDGHKNIEDIKIGDYVWSENLETGEKALKQVVNTFVKETDKLIHINVEGEKIVTTPEHPFYVPQKGWTSAVNLRAGEILVLRGGEYVTVEKIQHEILENPIKVYNFEVEDFHTYYVSDIDVLVHNMCFIKENRIPLDKETILKGKKFAKVKGRSVKGAQLYKKGNRYYHRDTLHKGARAHLEVYDKTGKHLGEADPITGKLISGTMDLKKSINIK